MRRLAFAFVLVCALSAVVLAVILVARTIQPHEPLTADDIASLSFRPHPGAQLPLGEHLLDESGRIVTLGAYFGKTPVILVLEYLRCTSLCSVTLRNLIGNTLNELPLEPGRDYQLVAISIDPRDQPSDAAAAAIRYAGLLGRSNGNAGLHFLTGAPDSVRMIADKVGFPYRYDALLDAYIHPAGFVIAAPDGLISHYQQGFATSPAELISAFADAQEDKSLGVMSRLILLCHVQGAPLGSWTVAVMAALMIADITAGLCAIAVFAAIRRSRSG
jgi:protein SCO1/2